MAHAPADGAPDLLWRAGPLRGDGPGRDDEGSPGGEAGPRRAQPARPPPGVAVLLMSRLRRSQLPWALWRLARGGRVLAGVPGLRFGRVLGSGANGGFGLEPGLDCQGVFALFDRLDDAERFATVSRWARAYRSRSREHFAATLLATSARGSWSGQSMSAVLSPVPGAPVAALTRAAIRPRRLAGFWRHSPPAEAELAGAPGCMLAVGLGEAPLLRQATFSVWNDAGAMDAFARHGAHQRAIRASYEGGFFSEWMFVRFVPVALRGCWNGRAFEALPP
ncbi:MAG: spheroidene monooxygenase [Pseudomonadota bacterium]|jgi:hypothetical protein|nr:spheroidene monooxygenase [Rubrivivax sp.]MCA3258662.1 spheroidene monooxygenase [Rubrivivax sp.]MCZ8030237.1 spheroidene monooxygenase [Rubrivivax sp.]